MEDQLQVCFVGQDGIDVGGLDLLKDMFFVFWEKAFKTYFTGESVFIPFLPVARLHEANRIYPILGRILSHSTALLQTIPVRFCRSTLLTLLHSPLEANEECLVNDFMNFITQSERQFLERAMRDYQSLTNSDKEEVKYIFWRFGMGVSVIREDNISRMVVNLARQELCIKPSCLCMPMNSGIPKKHMRALWETLSYTEINDLYKALLPTNSGVLSLLEANEDLRPDEDVIFYYLRDFIRGLREDEAVIVLAIRNRPRHPSTTVNSCNV